MALGQITLSGQRGCAEAEQSYLSTALPASLLWAPACQDKPAKTVGFEYGVICLLCMDHQSTFPAQHLHCHYAFSKRSHAHTWLNIAGQSPSTSLRKKQSLTAQLCSASLSWKFNQHIQVYPLLGGKILSPSTSRQSSNSKMKIPDTNHTAWTLSKWSITPNMAQQISHILCFTRVDLYSMKQSQSWAMNRASLQGTTRLEAESSLYPPHITQGPDSNPPTHSESKLNSH